MGRTYSFEPFRSQQPAQTYQGSGAKLGNDEDKTTLTKDEAQASAQHSSPHYGQNHSETVTRYRKKVQARKRAAKTAAPAKAAAKKATAKPAARTPARKQTASSTTPRMTTGTAKAEKTPTAKTPAAKTKTVVSPAAVRSLGRKVLTRAATAAKKGVASVVKKATKVAAARKPTKKR